MKHIRLLLITGLSIALLSCSAYVRPVDCQDDHRHHPQCQEQKPDNKDDDMERMS